jgi:hypothetical protein
MFDATRVVTRKHHLTVKTMNETDDYKQTTLHGSGPKETGIAEHQIHKPTPNQTSTQGNGVV